MKKSERQRMKSGENAEQGNPGDHSQLIGFIGGYLIDQGTLTLQQLDEALLFQLRHAEAGKTLSLADVLVRLRMATRQDIARAARRLEQDRAARR